MKNEIIAYNPALRQLARKLRKTGTRAEIYLWREIRKKRLGVEFHRQVPIGEFIVDFFCHEIMLAVEVDGFSHNIEEVMEGDKIRSAKLEELGVRIIRFEDKEVLTDMNNVIRELESTIRELGT